MTSKLLSSLQQSYQSALTAFTEFTADSIYLETTVKITESMTEIFKKNRKIMVCGNGGSACQAMHFAEELTGRYRQDRKALPALSLTDASHITCVGNDYGFEFIFSRAIEAYAQAGDGLLILTTSGNSPNLIRAEEIAKQLQVTTYALLGKGGGQLKGKCDYEMIVPGSTSDAIQNIHMVVIHVLIEGIERQLFPQNYNIN